MIELRIGAAAKSPEWPWSTIVGALPHLIWAAFAFWLLWWIGRHSLQAILARTTKLGVAGINFEFNLENLQQAAIIQKIVVSTSDLGRASRRLSRDSNLISGSRILWVDDTPKNNIVETALLEENGARIDIHTTTPGAIAAINATKYDIVVSDMSRPNEPKAGIALAETLSAIGRSPPVIIYTADATKPVPASAFGLTNRPDELVHLILDALARRRG